MNNLIKQQLAHLKLKCLLCLAYIDGEYSPEEVMIIDRFKQLCNIESSGYGHTPELGGKEFKRYLQLIKNLSEENDLNFTLELIDLMHWLLELSDADDIFDKKEQILIDAVRQTINLNLTVGKSKPIIWDQYQKEYLNASVQSRIMISAPPGAGKTQLISEKVVQLVKNGMNPKNLVLISFTNAAVNEMYSRIYRLSDGVLRDQINVVTLDSAVFSINVNLIEALQYDGYEQSLEIIYKKILLKKNQDFLDFWGSKKHIFIDEAQDLVGLRRKICLELILLSSDSTGVSVFGDHAQQIYPFNQASRSDDEMLNLMNSIELKNDISPSFKEINLTSIHRTKDKHLIKVIDDMREDIRLIQNNKTPNPRSNFENINDGLAGHASDKHLFLFKTHSQLTEAAHNLIQTGHQIRIRGGSGKKFPKYFPKWLESFLELGEQYDRLSREQFILFMKSKAEYTDIHDDLDYLWKMLSGIDPNDDNIINIDDFKKALKMRKNSVFFDNNFGFRGPLLSTIHAAKGTQADNVILNDWNNKSFLNKEEASILFVGVTRSKKKIQINQSGDEFHKEKNQWKQKKKGNRYYDPNVFTRPSMPGLRFLHLEIGINNDYDPYSIVDRNIHLKKAIRAQHFLRAYYSANKNPSLIIFAKCAVYDNVFHVYARDKMEKENNDAYEDICLGSLSTSFVKDVQNILWDIGLNQRYCKNHPIFIHNFKIFDVATFMHKVDDDKEDPLVHSKYLKRQNWLYPVLYTTGPLRLKVMTS